MHAPLVSVVIVNWNGLRFLERCLPSLFNQTWHDFEVIMVDNGSSDGSVRFVKDRYPQVTVIENKENLGFAIANNQGMNAARGKYIVLLNNDTEVGSDFLKRLAGKAESSPPDVGMWACKILSLHDHAIIDSVGGLLISSSGIAKGRGRNELDVKQYDGLEEVFIPSACAAMYRKDMLNKVGFFDEDFFAYCEDTDLGFRARLAGWKTISVPDAVVYHYYSGTTGRYSPMKAYLVERNHIWVVLKNFPLPRLILFPVSTIWRYLLQVYAILIRKGAGGRYVDDFSKASLIGIVLKAYLSAFKGMPGMLRKRRYIQARKTASSREISRWFKEYGLKMSKLVLQE